MNIFMNSIYVIPMLLLMASCSRKSIGRNYDIRRLDEGKPYLYYIEKRGEQTSDGIFDGIVKDIVWKNDEIIANVQKHASCDKSGWFKLNIQTGAIDGPIDNFSDYQKEATRIEDFYKNPQRTK